MAQRILNNGDSGLNYRTKENDNFTELFQIAKTFVTVARNTPETFNITTTPQIISFGDNVLYQDNMSYDVVTGEYGNIFAGIYGIEFFFTGNWSSGKEIFLQLYKNGIAVGHGITVSGAGSGKNVPLGVPSHTELIANEITDIRVSTLSGSTNLEVVSGNVTFSLKVAT